MIFWLLGLAVVIWYGSYWGSKRVNPWHWAIVGTIGYALIGAIVYFGILILFSLLYKAGAIEDRYTIVKVVAPIVKLSTIVIATYFATHLYPRLARWKLKSTALKRSRTNPETEGNTISNAEENWLMFLESLERKGYKISIKPHGWVVKEPLGARVKFRSWADLQDYANRA